MLFQSHFRSCHAEEADPRCWFIKYKYKPYLFNGKAVAVETTSRVFVDIEHSRDFNYTIR